MITKTKTKNSELVELFGELPKSSDLNKQKLIRMAKNGEDRPPATTKLGLALSKYTRKSSEIFDCSFTKTVKDLRPDWFISQTEKANQNKQILINIAKNGKDRPGKTTKIGASLCYYTSKRSRSYDSVFDKLIRKLRPDWFAPRSEFTNKNKQILISIAKNKGDRPKSKTKIGKALSNYTIKSSVSYDPTFTKVIKKLAPHWFVGRWWKS